MEALKDSQTAIYIPSRAHWAVGVFARLLQRTHGVATLTEPEMSAATHYKKVLIPNALPGITPENLEVLKGSGAVLAEVILDSLLVSEESMKIDGASETYSFSQADALSASMAGRDLLSNTVIELESPVDTDRVSNGTLVLPIISRDRGLSNIILRSIAYVAQTGTYSGVEVVDCLGNGTFIEELKKEVRLHGLSEDVSFSNQINECLESASAILLIGASKQNSVDVHGVCISAVSSATPCLVLGADIGATFQPLCVSLPMAKEQSGLDAQLELICNPDFSTKMLESWFGDTNIIAASETSVENVVPLAEEHIEAPAIINKKSTSRMQVLLRNRSNAFTHPGGDTTVMNKFIQGLSSEGIDVEVNVDDYVNVEKYDLVNLFNFAIKEVTEAHARQCVEQKVPYVVNTLYEDWPAFYNQMANMYLAAKAYVEAGQPMEHWQRLEDAAREVTPSPYWDNSYAANNSEALITTGGYESDAIRKDYPNAHRIIEVPLGCEVTEFFDDGKKFRSKFGVKDFVFCVGRLEWRKNQLMLLKALEDSDVTVVFADGGFTYQDEYAQLCKNFQRRGKTIFTGRLSDEELASAYQAASVHVLPSWFELPGLVSLEAARYGTPVVAGTLGTTRDYLGNAAYYCRPDSATDIQFKISEALVGSDKEALVTKAKECSWDRTVAKTAQMYREVLGVWQGVEDSMNGDEVITQQSAVDAPIMLTEIVEEHVSDEPTVITLTEEVVELSPQVEVTSDDEDTIQEEQEDIVELDEVDLCTQGDTAFKQGDLELARSSYQQAVDADAENFRAHRSLGVLALEAAEYTLAEEYFTEALRLNPKDAKAMLGQGAVQWRQGEKELGFRMYKEAARLDPSDPSVILYLVSSAYELNELDELAHCLRSYLREQPHDEKIQYCLAGCYFKQEKYTAARGVVQRLLALSPDSKEGIELREKLDEIDGIVNEDISNEQNTIHSQVEVAQVASTTASAKNGGAKELIQLEELKATRQYDEVAQLVEQYQSSGEFTDAAIDRFEIVHAESLGAQGKIEEARAIFQSLFVRSIEVSRVLAGLGALSAFESNWKDATDYFERSIESDPSNDLAFAGLGICAHAQEQLEDAWNYFTEALKHNPENLQSIYGLVQLGYEFDRLSDVEKFLREYLELKPVDISILYSLAGCLYAQGRAQEAVGELKNILLFEPEHEPALELMAQIEQDAGASHRV